MWRPIDRWATRRAVLAAHVLSRSEPARYAGAFGVEEGRFRFIPFAWRMQPVGAAFAGDPRLGVVSAGRADCDWPTLFEAARGAGWPLVVVCGEHDRAAVERLNADGRATVLVEIEHDRARDLLRSAAVCVLSIVESPASHGHVRLCDAVDAGAVVVASRVQSLDGYVDDGRTAILVAPGDPAAMRRAIDRLFADEGLRERFARAAFERAEAWTWDEYLRAIEAFVHGEAVPLPSAVFAGG
jgi:glycosyltransferase involved in cell wall biosynthesis